MLSDRIAWRVGMAGAFGILLLIFAGHRSSDQPHTSLTVGALDYGGGVIRRYSGAYNTYLQIKNAEEVSMHDYLQLRAVVEDPVFVSEFKKEYSLGDQEVLGVLNTNKLLIHRSQVWSPSESQNLPEATW